MRDAGEAQELRDAAAAARWLESLINLERRPSFSYKRLSLAPIEALLASLGHPERDLSVVHIAGSKGKGSTALLVEAVLRACGRRVGTFTSPHLERWSERFRIDGAEVEGGRLAAAVGRIRPHVEALRRDPARVPSFFDATTAVAWWLFREARVDHCVMEVGLGGRLDSTNAVAPAVTAITSIELEHTDKLGNTLAAIAAEKAGILKPGVPAVVGALPAEAFEVVESRAREVGAPLARLGHEIEIEASPAPGGACRLQLRDGGLALEASLPLLGAHQVANAALAVACARRVLGDAMDPGALGTAAARALARATLPGRIELLRTSPRTLVDSAHTEASARSLARVLGDERGPVHLVLSISEDKRADSVLDALLAPVQRVTLTRADVHRSLDAQALADRVRARLAASMRRSDVVVDAEDDPELALRRALAELPAGGTLCVAGSVYLAGIARRVLSARS